MSKGLAWVAQWTWVQSLGSNLGLEEEAFACDMDNILQQRTTYGVLEATVVKKQPFFRKLSK